MKKNISLALLTVLFSTLASATSMMESRYDLRCDGFRNVEGQRMLGVSQSLECFKLNDELLSCDLLSKAIVPNAVAKVTNLKIAEQSDSTAVLTDGSATVILNKAAMSASIYLKAGAFQLCK